MTPAPVPVRVVARDFLRDMLVAAAIIWLLAIAGGLTGCAVGNKIGGGPAGPVDAVKAGAWPRPASIEAFMPDGTPAGAVTIQAVDAAERHYAVALDDLGRGQMSIWTDQIPTWRVRSDGGGWIDLVSARVRKADAGEGFRISVTVPGGKL